ncbi:hypothetical protein N7488_006466 [Penicillium malachiteum]|nr:hypothetical protein N7488_006466 [Penicillium malachiteum]
MPKSEPSKRNITQIADTRVSRNEVLQRFELLNALNEEIEVRGQEAKARNEELQGLQDEVGELNAQIEKLRGEIANLMQERQHLNLSPEHLSAIYILYTASGSLLSLFGAQAKQSSVK